MTGPARDYRCFEWRSAGFAGHCQLARDPQARRADLATRGGKGRNASASARPSAQKEEGVLLAECADRAPFPFIRRGQMAVARGAAVVPRVAASQLETRKNL